MSEMDDLAAFAVLVEAGSFTLAAQQLGCSKGQLSKRISQLEAQFSVVLLQRTTRRLSLTAAGAALLPQAQALVVQVERARQALARLKDDMAGPVRMTVPVSLGETFFDGLLLEFSAQYPEVQIELELNNNYRDLSRDGFDLAIRSDVAIDQRLVARPLLAWRELTCASPAYLAQRGHPRNVAALAGADTGKRNLQWNPIGPGLLYLQNVAAAAGSLSGQARQLVEAVEVFRLRGALRAPALAAPSQPRR